MVVDVRDRDVRRTIVGGGRLMVAEVARLTEVEAVGSGGGV